MKQWVHAILQSVPATWNQTVSRPRLGTEGVPEAWPEAEGGIGARSWPDVIPQASTPPRGAANEGLGPLCYAPVPSRRDLGLEESPRMIWDVLIVGSGPSGLSAALFTRMRRMSTLLLETAVA